jgi:flagellar M-ring protein FliF
MVMVARTEAQKLLTSLKDLGPRKLGGLALVGLLVVAIVSLGGYYLSRPDMETLYSGLDRTDMSSIGAALTEAGIPFDAAPSGDAILTPFSQTAPARMLLAEKGLPRSENAGYELFDNLGSIGLTSFMQEVTRVRALEGEIARTIQSIADVRAARVHIVLPDEGSFRRDTRPPSASVVIRTDGAGSFKSAEAIRHLVAAAVPGMSVDEVTVLDTEGNLLASGGDGLNAAPQKLLGVEQIVSNSVQDSIRRTLAPYLGVGNFQSSVVARLNTDRRQISERTFDPEGRVERSTRTLRETGESQNATKDQATTVDQNLPQPVGQAEGGASGRSSSEAKERREELTNYEINEKTVSTTSDGYQVENLSVAVVVNRARLKDAIGADATDEQVDARLKQIEALVTSAAGVTQSRGDQLTVTAVDFLDSATALEPVPAPGTLINALTILVVAVLLVWFGIKPAIRALAPPAPDALDGANGEAIELANAGFMTDANGNPLPGYENGGAFGALGGPAGTPGATPALGSPRATADTGFLDDIAQTQVNSPQARLTQLVDYDEKQAAAILKQWIHEKKAA